MTYATADYTTMALPSLGSRAKLRDLNLTRKVKVCCIGPDSLENTLVGASDSTRPHKMHRFCH